MVIILIILVLCILLYLLGDKSKTLSCGKPESSGKSGTDDDDDIEQDWDLDDDC